MNVHIQEKSHLYTNTVLSASTNRQVERDVNTYERVEIERPLT